MIPYILAHHHEICNRTFHGWSEVPRQYRTRATWKRAFRRVAKGQKPTASVIIEEARRFDTIDAEYKIERSYNLFHVSQTKPVRKTALNVAQYEFYDHFVRHADRNKLIRWTRGNGRSTSKERSGGTSRPMSGVGEYSRNTFPWIRPSTT